MIHLNNGEIKIIPLDEIDFMKRYACRYCSDYSSEYADISFGGIGAEDGWTTVVLRSNLGRAIFADARGQTLDVFNHKEKPGLGKRALEKITAASEKKRKSAKENREKIGV